MYFYDLLQEDAAAHNDLLVKQIESETRYVLQKKVLWKKINANNFVTEYGTSKQGALDRVSVCYI